MNSAIYTGWVRHRRLTPVHHKLEYRVFMMLVDLDELAQVCDLHPAWSLNRRNLAQFRTRDYFGQQDQPDTFRQTVIDTLREESGCADIQRAEMLTNARYMGFLINPVTFYFGYDASNRCRAILAEVTNTPWGERFHYTLLTPPSGAAEITPEDATRLRVVLPERTFESNRSDQSNHYRYRVQKAFHVSPFNPMDMEYHWTIQPPAQSLMTHMNLLRAGQREFDATLKLERQPLTSSSLGRVLRHFPLMTTKVAAGIYWNAVKLWWRGSPFYSHPNNNPEQDHRQGLHQNTHSSAQTRGDPS